MALVTTTLSAACALKDKSVTVASATSVAAGRLLVVDGEVMKVTKGYVTASTTVPVLRGQNGTAQAAHVSGANATHGDASDFQAVATAVDSNYPANYLTKSVTSYSASGAISFGNAFLNIAILNGTSALSMTLAVPTKDQDGTILIIVGNGIKNHVVTPAGGVGGGALTTATFEASGGRCSMSFIAANAIWVPLPSPMSGTLTSIDVAMT